jgi:hypothetical protein
MPGGLFLLRAVRFPSVECQARRSARRFSSLNGGRFFFRQGAAMSVRGKEVRPLIDDVQHERLSIIAEYSGEQIAELAAKLLEKAIAYEWHEVSVLIERSERLGKRWKAAEGGK